MPATGALGRRAPRSSLGPYFTPRAGSVDVTLARNGAAARLAVTDTGRGIRGEFLPHVFERFRHFAALVRNLCEAL